MFDEQNQNNGVEDILAATEADALPVAAPPGPPSALAGGKLQPVQNNLNPAVMPLEQMSGGGRAGFPFKKIMALIIVVAVLGGGASAGYFWWQGWSSGRAEPVVPLGAPQDQAAPPVENSAGNNSLNQALDQFQQNSINSAIDPFALPPQSAASGAITAPEAAPSPGLDTDQDGLSDVDETASGTNPRLVDTDGDGLSDWEEVTVFGANPLSSDSDGDTFSDGSEVQNGYNPNGPGKLLDFEKAKSEAQ